MKKIRNYFVLCAVAILCAVSFASCGDDDDDVNVSKSALIGTWESVWETGYDKYGSDIDRWDEAYTDERVKFEEDGTMTVYEYHGSGWNYEFSADWTLSGNKIILKAGNETESATIEKLTDTELIVSTLEKGVDDGEAYEYYSRVTYKRVH